MYITPFYSLSLVIRAYFFLFGAQLRNWLERASKFGNVLERSVRLLPNKLYLMAYVILLFRASLASFTTGEQNPADTARQRP